MTYAITKKFISGEEYKELTSINMCVGKDYGDYVITSCIPVTKETTVNMTACRPHKYGGGEAFVSGSYSYIKECRREWLSSGYYRFNCWVD